MQSLTLLHSVSTKIATWTFLPRQMASRVDSPADRHIDSHLRRESKSSRIIIICKKKEQQQHALTHSLYKPTSAAIKTKRGGGRGENVIVAIVSTIRHMDWHEGHAAIPANFLTECHLQKKKTEHITDWFLMFNADIREGGHICASRQTRNKSLVHSSRHGTMHSRHKQVKLGDNKHMSVFTSNQ